MSQVTHISRAEYFRLVKKKPKYHNKLVTNLTGGIENHSKKEHRVAKDLFLELYAGKYRDVKEQVKVPLVVNGKHICDYVIDFLVVLNDFSEEYIEVKGMMTTGARLKIALFRALYPEKKLLVIQ